MHILVSYYTTVIYKTGEPLTGSLISIIYNKGLFTYIVAFKINNYNNIYENPVL